jgi:hypothetical protein
MRNEEVAGKDEGPSEPMCMILAPLLVVCLYYLYHNQLHSFKRQWKAKIESSASSLASQSRELDHSFKLSTSKLQLQAKILQDAYESEAEACHRAISEIQIAVTKLQLECQSEINCCVIEDKVHSPFQIATPKKNRHRKGSLLLLERANSVI